MASVKTSRQRQRARAASRRRRRRQDRRVVLVLVVLVAVLLGCVLWALLSKEEETPTNDTSSTTTAVQTTTATGGSTTAGASDTTTIESTVTTTTVADSTTTTEAMQTGHYVQGADAAWNFKLANDWNTLSQDYVATIPLEVVSGIPLSRYDWLFDSRAIPYLQDMVNAANEAGCGLWGQSLYRSYDSQYILYWQEVDNWLYQGYSQADAEKYAATVVKRPGQSEHNTGLALDFECSEFPYLDEGFEDTAAFRWLIENCADYGFILRFPKGKEDITGVIYEPWHYRYVGVEAAQEIMSRGICLEEYLAEKGL